MGAKTLRMAVVTVVLGLVAVAGTGRRGAAGEAKGGFGVPRPPDIPDVGDIIDELADIRYIIDNLPGFGLSMDEEEPVTTSLDDAVTEVPFLDNYPAAPVVEQMDFMPICELSRNPDGNYLLMPGQYEYTIESFCLHAGTYGPGHGDGYLWAPLKGPWSHIVYDILANSEKHYDIPQRDIQYLIWAVLARTDLSDMDPEKQRIARLLLTEDEIDEINMSAFGIIPQDLMGQVFNYVDVPPVVESVMRSQADIRRLVTDELASYDEVEAIAVLAGDPPASGEDREIPATRWSYHPDGYFVRYDPSGYSSNHLNIVVPDLCDVETEEDGSIISVEDEHGNRLEVEGSTLRFSCLDPADPWSNLETSWTGFDIDRLVQSGWTSDHRAEVVRLCGDAEWTGTIVELGRFAHAVESVVQGGGGADSEMAPMAQDLAKEAWMDAVVRVNLMKLPEDRVAMAKDLPEFDWRDRWRPLDPSDGSANPGNRGRQRLGGRDPRPSEDPEWGSDPRIPEYDPNKRPPAHTAREGINKFNDMNDKLSWIQNGPIGNVVNSVGFAIPNAVFGGLLEFTITLWDYCTGALSSDPPSANYDEVWEPEQFTFAPLRSPQDGSPEKVAALNALMQGSLELASLLKSAVITGDRQGGAAMAGDQNWSWEQAKAEVYFEREAGWAMYRVADLFDAYIAVLRAEDVIDIYVTPEDFRAGQERLEQEGFSAEQLAAARMLGMSDANIDAYLDHQLSLDPNEASGSILNAAEELTAALRGYGFYLINLPDVERGDFPGGWVEVGP